MNSLKPFAIGMLPKPGPCTSWQLCLTRPRKYLNSTKSYPLPAYAYVWDNETERLLDTLQADADIIIHTGLHDELETFRLARASCCGCAMTALLRLGRIGALRPTDVPTNEVVQRIANDPNTFVVLQRQFIWKGNFRE